MSAMPRAVSGLDADRFHPVTGGDVLIHHADHRLGGDGFAVNSGRMFTTAASDHRGSEEALRAAENIDPDTAQHRLAKRISDAHLAAGKPTLRRLGAEVGCSASTISRLLNGTHLPSWNVVRLVGRALQVNDATIQDSWLPCWIAASRRTQTEMSERSTTAKGDICPECGLLVGNADIHHQWHDRYDQMISAKVPAQAE